MSRFASALVEWQRRHGRKGLPWQGTRDPYRVWLSEVMLQQTQVAAVIPYYERFLDRFPTIGALAQATQEDVLRLWAGLGYYARGRNLHLASKRVFFELKSKFPQTAEALAELPGVGRSTAAAIAAFAFGERAAILDGNVKRLLARYRGIEGFPGDKAVEAKLWAAAESLLPKKDIEIYTQALMDLGATVCTKGAPRCEACPVRATCVARKEHLVSRIPAPRPRKKLPSRRATWLVLVHARQVLLERRPGAGIWGGLWSFPEVDDIARACREAGGSVRSARKLAPIEHGFTHFRLRIQPVLCRVQRLGARAGHASARAEQAGRIWIWIGIEEAKEAAVPAPVKALLGSLG